MITLPLLGIGALLTQLDFNVLWRYFSWSNQTLAAIALWAGAFYLVLKAAKKQYSLIAALPASFMSAVSVTYILMANEGFSLASSISYPIGIGVAVIMFGLFIYFNFIKKPKCADLHL